MKAVTKRHNGLRRLAAYGLLVVASHAVTTFLPAPVDAKSEPELLDKVKGAFVVKLTRYLSWDEAKAPPKDEAVLVGVAGQSAVAEALGAFMVGQDLDGRPFKIVRGENFDSVSGCRILYVGEDLSGEFQTVRQQFEQEGVLTIGEGKQFTEDGGIVRLYQKENKLAFEINRAAAKRSGIRFSSQILQLASIVEEDRYSKP